ncbi:unnamed protein product [Allacma fusca]|uniref:Uncharacterized protein n=1 Tax=Allacma fusca TaxID=39272 RepID=A0A8J2K172_9HEXA|nr:unnamed protein product [Allacma fusca]
MMGVFTCCCYRDLENNKISRIEPGWVEKLKVEHLTLSYNNLRSIGPSAFEGATIARLTLKGNHQLTGLHPNAFAGIESLRQLDLSETAITTLPTHGLKHLEILRLQRTPSLTVIPSIYHFEARVLAMKKYDLYQFITQ